MYYTEIELALSGSVGVAEIALMTNNIDLLTEFRNIIPTADLQAFESVIMTGTQGIIKKL